MAQIAETMTDMLNEQLRTERSEAEEEYRALARISDTLDELARSFRQYARLKGKRAEMITRRDK